jgi:hypothetical protein
MVTPAGNGSGRKQNENWKLKMTTAIQDAINAAQAQAAIHAQTQLAVAQPAAAPALVPAAGPLSLNDLMSGGISVDHWLKVKEDGLIIGDKRSDKLDSILVKIDMSAIQVAYAVKYDQGKVYKKSYDGLTTVGGGSWAESVAQAARISGNANPVYLTADIPMTLLEDVKGKKGDVLAEAGQTLGHGLSTTNMKFFRDFVRRLAKDGLDKAEVTVRLGYLEQTNTNKNVWGVVTFELVTAS